MGWQLWYGPRRPNIRQWLAWRLVCFWTGHWFDNKPSASKGKIILDHCKVCGMDRWQLT